jgi:hypothetical protein
MSTFQCVARVPIVVENQGFPVIYPVAGFTTERHIGAIELAQVGVSMTIGAEP